jgi:hypothetical protein
MMNIKARLHCLSATLEHRCRFVLGQSVMTTEDLAEPKEYEVLGTGDLSMTGETAGFRCCCTFSHVGLVSRTRRNIRWPESSVPIRSSKFNGYVERLSVALLQNEIPVPKPVRLPGVSLSSLQGEVQAEPQFNLPL